MKNSMIFLMIIFMSDLLIAQNDLSFIDRNTNESDTAKNETIKNKEYIYEFQEEDFSMQIRKFQELVANYDINQNAIYDKKDPSKYDVEFQDGKNKISVTYNSEGIIARCQERYKNIKLPNNINNKILQENPGWIIKNVHCNILYAIGKNTEIKYKITIQNGDETINLKRDKILNKKLQNQI